jgi:hypothetical protein
MGLLFKDDLLDEFGSWPIAYIPYMAGPISARSQRLRRRSETATGRASIQLGTPQATGLRRKPTRPSGVARSSARVSSSCGRASSIRPACAHCSARRSNRGSSRELWKAGRRA